MMWVLLMSFTDLQKMERGRTEEQKSCKLEKEEELAVMQLQYVCAMLGTKQFRQDKKFMHRFATLKKVVLRHSEYASTHLSISRIGLSFVVII